MKIARFLWGIVSFLMCWGISACSDNDPGLVDVQIQLSENEVQLGRVGRYYEVVVQSSLPCSAKSDADWLTLSTSVIPLDGVLEFYASTNSDDYGRTAEIRIYVAEYPDEYVLLTVRQRGTIESDDNALVEGELTLDFRVGWGYNIFQNFMSETSLTAPILDYNKLLKLEREFGDKLIQEDNRSYERMDNYSGYSLDEIARSFTSAEEKSKTGFLGAKKTVSKFVETNNYKTIEERCYGYARLSKVIASRYLDEAGLIYLAEKGEDIFSPAFNNLRNTVTKEPSNTNIDRMLKQFGTHLVISADIGGMIEYMVDFQKNEVTDVNTYTEVRSKYVFGKQQSSSQVSRIEASISTDCEAKKSFTITAGDSNYANEIRRAILGFNNENQIDQQLLTQWMNSIEGDYRNDDALQKRLAIVGCSTVPIWIFFRDKAIVQKIITRVEEMAKQSNFQQQGSVLGDNCMFEITPQMLTFDAGENSPLVKVVYYNDTPVAEICHEYIPDIRADRRVTVFYPLVKGKPNLNRGIFIGDGESNPPSYVAFEGSMVYVMPIENMKITDQVKKLYFINGNLYLSDMGKGLNYKGVTVENCYCILKDKTVESLPFVKMGSGYWLRANLKNSIYLGKYDNPDNEKSHHTVNEKFVNGKYYTNTFGRPKARYIQLNSNYFGTDKWYLPSSEDVLDLCGFFYKNAKALFVGQQSGFNAEFDGFYGLYDVFDQDKNMGKYGQYYKDEYCFVACKDDDYTGIAMILSPDYTLRYTSVNAARKNYYPVRLFRSKKFTYPPKK